MRIIKGIIFDVDGVITKSENIHFDAYKKILKGYRFDLTHDNFIRWFLGKSIKGGITSFLADNKLNIDINTFIQQKIDTTVGIYAENISFYQDTIDFIHKVSQGDIELRDIGHVKGKPILAMVTGLERVFMDILVKYKNFDKLFPIIVTATDYSQSKPDPECINITLSKSGLTASEVIGIEDSPSGIKALNNAGVFSIGITNTQKKEALSKASLIVNSLMSLFS